MEGFEHRQNRDDGDGLEVIFTESDVEAIIRSMPILKSEWTQEIAWLEFHLTAKNGWIGGTVRAYGGRYEIEIFAPSDRLMTVRNLEKIPNDPAEKPAKWSEVKWVLDDVNSVDRAQRDWGSLPRYREPLSDTNAEIYSYLPLIGDMCLPAKRRARGARVRPDRY